MITVFTKYYRSTNTSANKYTNLAWKNALNEYLNVWVVKVVHFLVCTGFS